MGKDLKQWKEQARQRLIAEQTSHRRGSGSHGADGAAAGDVMLCVWGGTISFPRK